MDGVNIIFDDGNSVVYRGAFNNYYYDVSCDKGHRNGKILISSNVLRMNKDSSLQVLRGIIDNYRSQKMFQDIKNVQFEFRVENQKEVYVANDLMQSLGIKGNVVRPVDNDRKRRIESYFKANVISKNENGKIISYIKRMADGNSSEYMLENVSLEELEYELNNVMMDANIAIDSLKDEEVAMFVLDRISDKKKKYFMESSLEHEAKNEKEEATLNATNMDDKVNMEIGVVEKAPGQAVDNSYRVVEREVDDRYKIVNPAVNEVSSVQSSLENDSLNQEEVESRNVGSVYYLDEYSGDIYDEKEELVGNIQEGYEVNYETNHLYKDGVDLGVLGDYKSMGVDNHLDKPMTRVLEKKEGSNVGNVSFLILVGLIVVGLVILGIVIYYIS